MLDHAPEFSFRNFEALEDLLFGKDFQFAQESEAERIFRTDQIDSRNQFPERGYPSMVDFIFPKNFSKEIQSFFSIESKNIGFFRIGFKIADQCFHIVLIIDDRGSADVKEAIQSQVREGFSELAQEDFLGVWWKRLWKSKENNWDHPESILFQVIFKSILSCHNCP